MSSLNPLAGSGEDGSLSEATATSKDAEELLPLFSAGDPTDVQSLAKAIQESFGKDLADLGKGLFHEHAGEKQGVLGVHVLHLFDAAMKAAFPGWPEDTTAANEFASSVFFSEGGVWAPKEGRRDVSRAFKRFTAVLWPGTKVPENRQVALLKILAKGVKYCTADYIDRKYKVELGPPVTRRGEVFDSQTLFDQKINGRYLSGSVAAAKDETRCRCIWVMTWSSERDDPVFYTHVGKLGRFHHSSFKSGKAIMAAGEWVIKDGRLNMINACSGHYRPEAWRFRAASIHLKNKGVISPTTRLEVWKAGSRELVPCLDFLGNFAARLDSGYSLYPA